MKFALYLLLVVGSVFGGTGDPYTLINRIQTDCELEALSFGTRLGDAYNSYDEGTEWDVRMHNDFVAEHLAFSGWIQAGLWKSGGLTAEGNNAPTLQKV